jgi:hypothetical protein
LEAATKPKKKKMDTSEYNEDLFGFIFLYLITLLPICKNKKKNLISLIFDGNGAKQFFFSRRLQPAIHCIAPPRAAR